MMRLFETMFVFIKCIVVIKVYNFNIFNIVHRININANF